MTKRFWCGLRCTGFFESPTLRSALGVSFLLILAVLSSAHVQADDSLVQPRMSAGQLALEVVRNELTAQDQDKSLWKYRENREEDGKLPETHEVLETREGELHRLIAVNGKPLTLKQRLDEQQRIKKILANPDDFRQKQKSLEHDADQERKLLQMLPQAFLYTYDGTQDGFVRLKFRPNPQFHADSHESEVFHHMEGDMLVDRRTHRLAEIQGRLMTEVKFWDGLLGHLDKGGTFCVEQRDVGGGHWELTQLDVEMNGKALFFKTITVHEKQVDTDFRPLPDHTTLKQAGQLLTINTNTSD